MLRSSSRWLALAAALFSLAAGWTAAGEVLSTMRNVNAVPEAHGFMVVPAPDVTVAPLSSDLSPGQAFEIVRPDGRPVTIGRLFTSCTCIQLQAHKRTFGPDERAILQLRNIRPTPPAGQVYAIFVQITSPVRTTLRFDTFVQSRQPGMADAPATPPAAGEQAAAAPAPTSSSITPPPSGGNSDLAAQLTAQLGAAESDHQDDLDLPELSDEEGDSDADAGMVRLDDGSEAPELVGELRDELEAMLDQELAARRANLESGLSASGDFLQRGEQDLRDMGTADLAYDLTGDLPDFHSGAPAAGAAPTPMRPPAEGTADIAVPAPEPELPPAPVAEPTPEPEPEPVPAAPAASALPTAPAVDIAAQVSPVLATGPAPVAQPPAAPEVQPAPAQVQAVTPPQRDPSARKPVQAVSLITVGVRDMAASIRFYEALGWRRAARGKYDQTAFFQLQGQILALYPIADLLREQNMDGATPAPGGITLALHVNDKADVWSVYQRFVDAGGQSLRPPAEVPSGAVSCYVADPDGNAWEISWVPQFRIDDDGGLWLMP